MGNSDICRFALNDTDHDRALRNLKFLRSKVCPWDGQKCAYNAAQHGNIEALKWLRAQGVVFEEKTCRAAANLGHLETLKYLYIYRMSIVYRLYEYAIEDIADPIPVIKLLQKNQYPWHSNACEGAAIYENLKLLGWLKCKGCPWDENVCNWAVKNNDFAMLKYAHRNGCPWTKETYTYCFSSEGLENEYYRIPDESHIQCSSFIFKYLQRHNCRQPDRFDWNIIAD